MASPDDLARMIGFAFTPTTVVQGIDSTQTGWLRLSGATKRNSDAATTGRGAALFSNTVATHGTFGKTATWPQTC